MPSDPPSGTNHQHSPDDDIIASDRMAALLAEGQHQIYCSHSILCAASARREEIEFTGWAQSRLLSLYVECLVPSAKRTFAFNRVRSNMLNVGFAPYRWPTKPCKQGKPGEPHPMNGSSKL